VLDPSLDGVAELLAGVGGNRQGDLLQSLIMHTDLVRIP
jgi:hypothetical protein